MKDMITLKINAKDANDLGRQLKGLYKLMTETETMDKETVKEKVEAIKARMAYDLETEKVTVALTDAAAAPVTEPKHADVIADETPADTAHQPKHEAPAEVKAEDVQKALAGLLKRKGKDEVKALLQRYGAERFPDLDPSHYAEVKTEAEHATK